MVAIHYPIHIDKNLQWVRKFRACKTGFPSKKKKKKKCQLQQGALKWAQTQLPSCMRNVNTQFLTIAEVNFSPAPWNYNL